MKLFYFILENDRFWTIRVPKWFHYKFQLMPDDNNPPRLKKCKQKFWLALIPIHVRRRVFLLYRLFKSFSSEWNLRWLQTQSYFLYCCVQKKLEQKKEAFSQLQRLKSRNTYLLGTWAKKIIYRPTDPLHFSTVGIRQTNNFLRTA